MSSTQRGWGSQLRRQAVRPAIACPQAEVSSSLLHLAQVGSGPRATPVLGRVRSLLTYAPLGEGMPVHSEDGAVIGSTCEAALGETFAAGTSDGPGM